MTNLELRILLSDALCVLQAVADCAKPECECEGNDEPKQLAERLEHAIRAVQD